MKAVTNILIITDSIDVEDSSGSKANVALARNLALAGFKVDVFHYTLRDLPIEGVQTFAIKEIKYSPLYFLSRLQRVLSRKFGIEMARPLERIFGFSFTFFNDVRGIRRALEGINKQYDLVLTLSKGGSFRPHYAVLKLPQLHSQWMAYVHDPYPMHYYPRPYTWVEVSHEHKERFFREVSQKARYSAFPSQLLLEWMGSFFENFLNTGVVIPHQDAPYTVKKPELPGYFDKERFTLLHAGNLMKQRSPKALLDGYLQFLADNPEAKDDSCLYLLGPADYHKNWLLEYDRYAPNIYLKPGNVAFDTVFNLQQHATVNIILESKSEISPFLPAKFSHCVAADRPIMALSPYYSETRRLLGSNYPYVAEADDSVEIAKVIGTLYQRWKTPPNSLRLDRPDLRQYLSSEYLSSVLQNLPEHG